MASIEPYTISVPEEQRQQLSKKLELTTFPGELDQADWDYGAPLADVKKLATYWREKFDWPKQEAKLNELPNFKTTIQVDGFESLDIHFIYQKSNVEGAIPLLFSHGCAFVLSVLQLLLLIISQGLVASLKLLKFYLSLLMAARKLQHSISSLLLYLILDFPPVQRGKGSAYRNMLRHCTSSCSSLGTINMVLHLSAFKKHF